MNTYSFISRFLDNEIPAVTANFKEFLLKDGLLPMLISFVSQNFPKAIQGDIEVLKQQQHLEKMNKIKEQQLLQKQLEQQHLESTDGTITTSGFSNNNNNNNNITSVTNNGSTLSLEKLNISQNILAEIPMDTIKSKKVMDLFVHPSPPFISLIKEKLPLTVSCLFEIFNSESKGNIYHFCKILNCLFYQFTFDFINQLTEIQESSGKSYFQVLIDHLYHLPIQDFFVIIAKRASSSVNEYQTSNPIDTKKIQKSIQKSKVFNIISNYFTHIDNQIVNETSDQILEGSSELIIKIIEDLNIYGPDTGLPIFCFQTKEFVDSLLRIMYNEQRKYTFVQKNVALNVLSAYFKQSIDYSSKNEFQREKDSVLSPSGSSSWVLYFSINHLADISKILVDIGNDPNLKKNLSHYRLETFNLFIEMLRARTQFKRKLPNQQILPVELWYFLVDWFFQFGNIYHSKFLQLIQELFSQGHIPSIKHFCSIHLKRFISFYQSESQSECRGVILVICNYIRITSTQLPLTHCLPTFLKSNEQWIQFLPILVKDTVNQYTDDTLDDQSNYQSKLHLIDIGTEFADSIGFEDEDKKQQKNEKSNFLMIDELNPTSSTNGATAQMQYEQALSSLEQELTSEEKKNKKNKNNKQGKKKK
ncbi:hypothetical protein DLAC_11491 [Tieghemostelium lacteum]|uniref:Uncharacterized protein n=1 Tax=Tieghemostelium lacteum TaxID=361077 RepID=A0A152A672_TIELA|nr:hypothetical protein DLAC_11491 [Tieghemostelium lacteum]|eukprot:KYR01736.1 hypothetical protein DLAC_11491 [Tieghemostelium lacteum]